MDSFLKNKGVVITGASGGIGSAIARLFAAEGARRVLHSPGWTVVPRTARPLPDAAVVRRVTATMALEQVALPEDIANAVVFLDSDVLARHIPGQNMVVAGGDGRATALGSGRDCSGELLSLTANFS